MEQPPSGLRPETKMAAPLRFLRRGVHDLADRWSVQHAIAVRTGRVGWPRPHSPLASLIGQASDSVAAAEQAAAAAASARRLPPVDEATSFESYLNAVGTLGSDRPLSADEQAEQIRIEAAAHRANRRSGLSGLAGDFLEEQDVDNSPLPAGRVDPDEAAGRLILDRNGGSDCGSSGGGSSGGSGGDGCTGNSTQEQRPHAASPRPPRRAEPPAVARMRQAIRDFRLAPREVKAHLDCHVIGQVSCASGRASDGFLMALRMASDGTSDGFGWRFGWFLMALRMASDGSSDDDF